MADQKISAETAASILFDASEFPVNEAGTNKKVTGAVLKNSVIGKGSSTGNQTGFAADTYLAGSAIAAPESFKVGTQYHLTFDMVKTAAGVATPILVVRVGTLGTTGDAAILTFTFAAGTAAIDTATVDVDCHFRTVGAGTSAVLVGKARVTHHLAATGFTSTGASGTGILLVTSAGFNSNAAFIIGASFNGGAAFSGTNVVVESSIIGA